MTLLGEMNERKWAKLLELLENVGIRTVSAPRSMVILFDGSFSIRDEHVVHTALRFGRLFASEAVWAECGCGPPIGRMEDTTGWTCTRYFGFRTTPLALIWRIRAPALAIRRSLSATSTMILQRDRYYESIGTHLGQTQCGDAVGWHITRNFRIFHFGHHSAVKFRCKATQRSKTNKWRNRWTA